MQHGGYELKGNLGYIKMLPQNKLEKNLRKK
jgi:hypothetical protein